MGGKGSSLVRMCKCCRCRICVCVCACVISRTLVICYGVFLEFMDSMRCFLLVVLVSFAFSFTCLFFGRDTKCTTINSLLVIQSDLNHDYSRCCRNPPLPKRRGGCPNIYSHLFAPTCLGAISIQACRARRVAPSPTGGGTTWSPRGVV